ncbi:MAG: undecaprenyldiphospho-muramoylpentapeptide beta-N-acetylglucosaminyltransferase [Christensenellales bacterium]|jgi:UDP-N-acetylglucosamine--N-acetylmuramyl-(pentapeptide) pyrophosphoryl-undecaprenol N-acetylglucosamine transferase|nr:undecaprenyldiphospho-muramoylpentapeptide beta-N-acetylglucosaminyltransferase [Clostridiales bacterium]
MRTIVLTGGGTGGHIIPNLALIPYLKKHFDQIHYIGSDGPEKDIVPDYGIIFHQTDAVKLDRIRLMNNFKIPFVLIKSIKQARRLLKQIKPSAVFSKGGYVSLPTCFAARLEQIPVVAHESDMSLGLANKIVSKFAQAVITSFEETKKGEYIGNPIRNEIFQGKKEKALQKYKIKSDKPIVLIFGGSSGSAAINDVVYQSLPMLTQRYSIVHIAGKRGAFDIKRPYYTQMEYAKDIYDLYAAAEVVVSRAGANTLSELAALNKKMLVIPLPKTSSRGDQIENALSYQKKGLAVMLEQKNLNPKTLIENIDKLYSSPPPAIKTEKDNVNERIVKRILQAAKISE